MMNALGKVESVPKSTMVGTVLLVGAAASLTMWSRRGGKTRDPYFYAGGGALFAAAVIAV
jgi:hypothetical protein